MAAGSTSILMEEAGLCNVPNQALQACPEVLSALYAAHYSYVLRVCRRFLWQPEDAEDAAAEVFLKLHKVLGSHDLSLAFRPWLSQDDVVSGEIWWLKTCRNGEFVGVVSACLKHA